MAKVMMANLFTRYSLFFGPPFLGSFHLCWIDRSFIAPGLGRDSEGGYTYEECTCQPPHFHQIQNGLPEYAGTFRFDAIIGEDPL